MTVVFGPRHASISKIVGVAVALLTTSISSIADDLPVVARWQAPHLVSAVAMTEDATRVVAAGPHGLISVWDVGAGDRIAMAQGTTDDSTFVCISPDGRRFAVGGIEGHVRVFDLATGVIVWNYFDHGSRLMRGSFSPDGKYLVTTCWDGVARIFDAADGTPRWTIPSCSIGLGGVAWRADSEFVLSGPIANLATVPWMALVSTVEVRRVGEANLVRTLSKPMQAWAVAWDEESGTVFVGDDQGVVRQIDPATTAIKNEWDVATHLSDSAAGLGVVAVVPLDGGNRVFAITMNGQGGIFSQGEPRRIERPTTGFVSAGGSRLKRRLALATWSREIEIIDLSSTATGSRRP